MEYILGLITGLLLALIVLVATARYYPAVERTLNRTVSVVRKKGEIIEPENEELEDWIEKLKRE